MAVIAAFTLVKDGGWTGSIQTLTIDAKLRLVPNENRANDNAPAFRAFVGQSHIGDAWEAHSSSDPPKPYLRLRLDDPIFPSPLNAALFPSLDGGEGQLVWCRRLSEG